MQGKIRPRCAVLGLDGLPFSLAERLAGSGDFPNLSRLVGSENCFPMHAELPELSPVNWTSFFTASAPEKHGIFGFTSLDPNNYNLFAADFNQVLAPTIFSRLGEKDLLCKCINLPNTYPAPPINGMLISGFVAPMLQKAVYPKFLLPRLQAEGYKLEADTSQGLKDPDYLLSELHKTLASREKALDLFWPDLDWDLFILVLTETDRLGHFLFPAISDTTEPMHAPCMQFLQRWDNLIGEFLVRFQALPEPKRLLVLADHGFTNLKTEVDINTWLQQAGLLVLANTPQNEWDSTCISPRSKAFALDPGRIYLHRRDKFKRGCLSRDECSKLLPQIKTGLENLTWQGQTVMDRVIPGEELYPESRHKNRPDLVCLARPGFDLKAKFDRKEVFGLFGRRGTHTWNDVFYYDSLGEKSSRVSQVGEKILHFFHL